MNLEFFNNLCTLYTNTKYLINYGQDYIQVKKEPISIIYTLILLLTFYFNLLQPYQFLTYPFQYEMRQSILEYCFQVGAVAYNVKPFSYQFSTWQVDEALLHLEIPQKVGKYLMFSHRFILICSTSSTYISYFIICPTIS